MGGKFNLLLAGSGNVATSYVKAISDLPELNLAGIVSRSGKRPAGAPETLPVFPTIAAGTAICDAVILAVPNGCHHDGCLEAAKLGKHVFSEKPLALTREDMTEMISVCREHRVQLAVAYQHRTAPDNRAIHDLLTSGALGRVIGCELTLAFWRPQSYYDSAAYRGTLALDGGGVFVQQSSHNLDLYAWFFGLPERVHAFTGTFVHKMEGEDFGSAILRHADGMIGTITAATAAKPGFPARMTIHTTKGTLATEANRIVLWEMEGVPNPASAPARELHCAATSHAVTATGEHEILLADFADKCRHGGKVLVSGEDAYNATELILRIYEAARCDA